MGEIVTLLHPGPVLHIPRRGRVPTLSFMPLRTPVRLREVESREIPEVAAFDLGNERHFYHEIDGQLWKRMEGSRRWGPSLGLDVAGLVRILEGNERDHALGRTDIIRALEGSPVLGPTVKGIRKLTDVDLAASRQVIDNARDEAVGCARRWVEERILLAGGKIFVRAHTPVGVLGQDWSNGLRRCAANRLDARIEPYSAHWLATRTRSSMGPNLYDEVLQFPFRLDEVLPSQDFALSYLNMFASDSQHAVYRMTGIPSYLLDDGDLALMANVLPKAVLALSGHLRRLAPQDADLTAIAASAAELSRDAVRGSVGMHGIDDAEEVLGRVSQHCAALVGILGEKRVLLYPIVAAWCEKLALPRLAERRLQATIDPEDEAALDGLTMGM